MSVSTFVLSSFIYSHSHRTLSLRCSPLSPSSLFLKGWPHKDKEVETGDPRNTVAGVKKVTDECYLISWCKRAICQGSNKET